MIVETQYTGKDALTLGTGALLQLSPDFLVRLGFRAGGFALALEDRSARTQGGPADKVLNVIIKTRLDSKIFLAVRAC